MSPAGSRLAGRTSGGRIHPDEALRDEAMRLALRYATQGQGRVWPNPSVGAVVFRGGQILGAGTTRPPPGPHAEIVALRAVARRHGERALRGASLAVTLEPCAHHGRTGPCAEALIEAGIGRVYSGCADPNPKVAGAGHRKLRRAGAKVETGVLADACRESHRGFLSRISRRRPFVTLKLASTLDGRIATASGESRWITGPRARRFVHELRRRVDAVMVGSGTALADDPQLTARRNDRVIHSPVRVLVDSRLRVPLRASLYREIDRSPTWVMCGQGARGALARSKTGARLFEQPLRGGHLDLARLLRELGKAGLNTLLVEGGGELAAALLRAKLVDEIHWLLAPKLIGGDGRAALGALGLARLAQAAPLRQVTSGRLGDDFRVSARLGDFP